MSTSAICLPKWRPSARFAFVPLSTNPKSARWRPTSRSESPGTRCQIAYGLGETETVPKQVVARGSRSVGELLCTVDNDKLELLPNINVNVRINSNERDNVLAVPRGSVEGEGGKRYVYVVKRGELGKSKLERREIQVGIADSTNYEIVCGLQPGEMVALPGDVDLKDGMAVTS